MRKIKNYVLPAHTNTLYEEEAISSIGLTREIAAKINELVDAYNSFAEEDLKWKHTQEGTIRKGVLYMKDNLLNSLHELLQLYNDDSIRDAMYEFYGEDLLKQKYFITPQMYGALGNGIKNDTVAIKQAIAAMKPGDILYFPKGTYLMTGSPVVIDKENITIMGEGLIKCDYGFRPTKSNFKAVGIRMESTVYAEYSRAFEINKKDETDYVQGFIFKDCQFKNFFYAVAAVGGSYTYDGTEEATGYKVRDVVIENCYSETYEDQNAGHFQCIQVENISYINNRTYGGKNATSYNAIKGNGFIRVVGNYDHNNSYGSCEIENGTGKAIVANNTFGSKIWIDDSYDVVVNANTTEANIHITVGSNNGDANNIIVSNNNCKNIRCEQFGTYKGGIITNINIHGNIIKGDNTHGIWIHGNAVRNAKVCNNSFTGINENDIAIQRNEQLTCYIQGNFGNGNKILFGGIGGKVYAVDNYNFVSSGNRDSLPASHLERSFNGLKLKDVNDVEWRIDVNTSGDIFITKYNDQQEE